MSEDLHRPGDEAPHTLPAGSVVGGLEITGVIGEGGFGIVYLAFDATLQRQVALKEYMPSSLAARSMRGPEVSVKSPRFQETFDAGLRSFVNEARLLAHFDHPALVKVHQFWQGNRTAYMVMPFYEGPTLKEHVRAITARSQPPNEATLRAWIDPLLDALALMHVEHCFHRDIAPDNVLLTPRGPLLLDLGAARKVIADMTQALTVILKPGYAPIEQYGEATSMVQGPWTDLYALASVVYFCITGRSPITSVERLMGDPLPLLGTLAAGRYGDAFLQAIDAALAVRPTDRPQSVAELRGLLDGTLPPRRQAPRGPLQTTASVEPPVVPKRADVTGLSPPRTQPLQQPTRPDPSQLRAIAPAATATPPRATTSVSTPPAASAIPTGAEASERVANRKLAATALWSAAVVAMAALAVAFWAVLHKPGAAVPTAASPQVAPSTVRTVEAIAAVPLKPSPPSASAPAIAAAPLKPSLPPASASAIAAVPLNPSRPPASAPVVEPNVSPSTPTMVEPSAARTASPKSAPKPAPASTQSSERVTQPAPRSPIAAEPDPDVPDAAARPKATVARPARCGELLEKGNQGKLTLEEATFLRQSCR